MEVTFKRTGARQYSTIIADDVHGLRELDPAPGYHDYVPHDLAHYIVECELGLTNAVFGRAERGGGMFRPVAEGGRNSREARRQARKQRKREDRMRDTDHSNDNQMDLSEQLAGLSLVHWVRRHDPTARPPAWIPATVELDDDVRAALDRVGERLDTVASAWHRLRIGETLTFRWPNSEPIA
ncbi:hypothetical protein HLB23_38700 [Nocardia uniformis]|uniref:Uncharacterized protein n=1 Tax=Nocardia uniformis TaxID=53432 RepID=A0A849CCS1_9NOCA|nr:hypothetical protein [Nocardia uniformis]NNH75716.1 hypothetical protein [Nocardia uniformis]